MPAGGFVSLLRRKYSFYVSVNPLDKIACLSGRFLEMGLNVF